MQKVAGVALQMRAAIDIEYLPGHIARTRKIEHSFGDIFGIG
jgi:hypothetical protein